MNEKSFYQGNKHVLPLSNIDFIHAKLIQRNERNKASYAQVNNVREITQKRSRYIDNNRK